MALTGHRTFQRQDLVSWKLYEVKQRTERLVFDGCPIGFREIESRSVRFIFLTWQTLTGITFFGPAAARSSVTFFI